MPIFGDTDDPPRKVRGAEVPPGFPDELRPHAREVFKILREVATRKNADDPTPLALAQVIMARPRKPLVKAARDWAAWQMENMGRRLRSPVQSYRNWIDKENDLARTEALWWTPGWEPPLPENVTRLSPRDRRAADRDAVRRRADAAREKLRREAEGEG